jgi:hypothetical protein
MSYRKLNNLCCYYLAAFTVLAIAAILFTS